MPSVKGAVLSREDFSETVAALADGGRVAALRRPPALQRALCSKVHRGAVAAPLSACLGLHSPRLHQRPRNPNVHSLPFPPLGLAPACACRSQACRSAIMFGDALTKAQCSQLLSRLAHTRLPFQCAHGRPSMTPLVTLPPCS